MAGEVTGREAKFRTLVGDFVATAEQFSSRPVDPAVIERELADRIRTVSQVLTIQEKTVLRDHIPTDWGVDMAKRARRDLKEHEAAVAAEPDAPVPVFLAGRLVAALGQALLYYATNEAAADRSCRFNPIDAAQAVTGLGVLLAEHAHAGGTPGGGGSVLVSGEVLAYTRQALAVFCHQLQQRRWTLCPCGQDCGSASTDAKLLDALSGDLEMLAAAC
jgi:hypothetical protein